MMGSRASNRLVGPASSDLDTRPYYCHQHLPLRLFLCVAWQRRSHAHSVIQRGVVRTQRHGRRVPGPLRLTDGCQHFLVLQRQESITCRA